MNKLKLAIRHRKHPTQSLRRSCRAMDRGRRFTMFALTKFARLAGVGTVVIAAALSLPVRADDQPQNLGPVGPHEPILSPVGSKRVIAFYTPDSGHCGLRVVVWNPADADATSTIGLRMRLIPFFFIDTATTEKGSLG